MGGEHNNKLSECVLISTHRTLPFLDLETNRTHIRGKDENDSVGE